MSDFAGTDTRTEYTVRESRRARFVTIRITSRGQVVVVIPRRFDRRRIPGLVAKKSDWIERHVSRICEERGLIGNHYADVLPAGLELRALGEDWTIDYVGANTGRWSVTEKPGAILRVRGNLGEKTSCKAALRRWLVRRARAGLLPQLRALSVEANLPYQEARLRGPRTRWASCSSRKNISLNYKMLFLPPALVRYVFLHELCHTVRLNHSKQFWGLLARYEPDCLRLNGELRHGWGHVPLWLD